VTDSGGDFADEGVGGFGAAFYEFAEIAVGPVHILKF
jgi:hypothetical protein